MNFSNDGSALQLTLSVDKFEHASLDGTTTVASDFGQVIGATECNFEKVCVSFRPLLY